MVHDELITFIVIGLPIVSIVGAKVIANVLKAKTRIQELRVEEERLKMEQGLRSDELNARILRMDDLGTTPQEIASLTEEVRQLREEVSRLKQDATNRPTA